MVETSKSKFRKYVHSSSSQTCIDPPRPPRARSLSSLCTPPFPHPRAPLPFFSLVLNTCSAVLVMATATAVDCLPPKSGSSQWASVPVRQLRHHFGPFLAHFSAPRYPARAMGYALLRAHANQVLVGAWNSMLCPIWGSRHGAFVARGQGAGQADPAPDIPQDSAQL